MGVTVSITNQKGGVGKTSMLASLSQILTEQGYKVLCVDMDPQRNLDMMAGPGIPIPPSDTQSLSTLQVLRGECSVQDAIIHTPLGDLIRACSPLSGWTGQQAITAKEYAELRDRPDDLVAFLDKRFAQMEETPDHLVLRKKIKEVEPLYDFIFYDTNPSLMLLTMNALYATDYVLIPVFPDDFSKGALGELWNTIESINYYEPDRHLRILGIVMSRVNTKTILSRSYTNAFRAWAKRMDTVLFDTKIRERVTAGEATAAMQSVVAYSPYSDLAVDYRKLANEFLSRVQTLEGGER